MTLAITPDQWTAILTAAAVVLTALGGATTMIIKAITAMRAEVGEVMVKTTSIQETTNGHATAMREEKRVMAETIEGLEARLAASIADAVQAALVAEQAATDVRDERTTGEASHTLAERERGGA
jgi:hypothetical protein